MGQKLPLPSFGGMIKPVIPSGGGGTVQHVFTPPDKNSDNPAIYEVHLYLCPNLSAGAADPDNLLLEVRAYEGAQVADAVPVWKADAIESGARLNPIVKVLDGYPVRGDVTLELVATQEAPVPATRMAVWGYYHRVGQGELIQPERRPIGMELDGFNAGVPFRLDPGENEIIHYFEGDTIDEISLALLYESAPSAASTDALALTFEDINNVVLAAAFFQPKTPSIFPTIPLPAPGLVAILPTLPPFGSLFPPSPYQIYQCPFGNGLTPALHHLRASNLLKTLVAFVHGYFTRR